MAQEPTIWGLALRHPSIMLFLVASSAIFPKLLIMTKSCLLMFVAAGLWPILPANGEVANAPKVTVPLLEVQGGEFRLGGSAIHAVGVNYFDGFRRLLEFSAKQAVNPPEYAVGMDLLAKYKIPFARFAAGGFYPVEWHLFRDDPEKYFALLDRFVEEAGARGIGLIPSLFWAHFAVPDLCEEPISAWGDKNSKTRAFMRRYTKAVVLRYRDSQAIWAWEFGNEFMMEADLQSQVKVGYWVVPDRGTATKRTAADFPSSGDLIDAYREFAEIVRNLDPKRPVMTGDAMSRGSAWHLAHGKGWKGDSAEQWRMATLAAAPGKIDTISLHIYHPRADGSGYPGCGLAGATLARNFELAAAAARASGKPLWLGEFGAGIGETSIPQRKEQVDEMLTLIERHRIGLSAYWVFDSINPDIGVWNITATNDNSWILDRIAATNARLAGKGN